MRLRLLPKYEKPKHKVSFVENSSSSPSSCFACLQREVKTKIENYWLIFKTSLPRSAVFKGSFSKAVEKFNILLQRQEAIQMMILILWLDDLMDLCIHYK